MKSVLNFERLSFFVIAPIDMFIPQFCGSFNFFFNSPRRVSCFYDLFYKVQFEICFNRVNTSRESWSPPKTRIIYLIFLFDLVICFILQYGCGGDSEIKGLASCSLPLKSSNLLSRDDDQCIDGISWCWHLATCTSREKCTCGRDQQGFNN